MIPTTTEPAAQTNGPVSRRVRWKRWVVLGAALLLLGAFGRFAYLRITRQPTPRPEHWIAVMAALNPPPPGAIAPNRAEGLLSSLPWESDPALVAATMPAAGGMTHPFDVSRLLDGSWDLSRPDCAAVDVIFRGDVFKTARSKMNEATRAGWQCTMMLDYDTLLPWLPPARRWCKWLAVHSRWVIESGGDPNEAVEDWLIALRLARQMRRPQATDLWLVEAACMSLVAEEMMLAAPRTGGRVDVSILAREVDAILGPPPRPRDILAGEYVMLRHFLEKVFVREDGDWIDVSEAAASSASSRWGRSGARPSRWWNLLSPLFHNLPEAQRRLDRHFGQYDACTDLVQCEQFREDDIHEAPEAFTVLDGAVDGPPWFGRAITLCYRARCDMEAALAMLAIEAFRHRNGRYPERLDDLVSGYLPRLPIDYADHRPLRYRRKDDDYVLYSIGTNGLDDGGRSSNAKRRRDYEGNGDAVFTQGQRAQLDPNQ